MEVIVSNLVLATPQFSNGDISVPLPRDIVIFRRMRIFRKITREDAGRALSRSAKVVERFENGRQRLSAERKKILLRRYRYTWGEYLQFMDGKNDLPDLPPRSIFKSKAVPRIDGRKYQKHISKGSRVLKILRKMKGWSQPLAAQKCGWSRSCIDHLENGRVELTDEKIVHILESYECKQSLYDELLEAPMLRDEVVAECIGILAKLDNDKLRAVKALLDNFR
jgi:transcriptional regulator with XRE-family HTH domain